MRDRFGREIRSLRISITKRCNLNCFYCHNEGQFFDNNRELTPEEIEKIVRVSTKFGVRKIKITGGEPLIRKDIIKIIKRIKNIREIKEIALTTNGTLLKKYFKQLKIAGLDRINVSLDTLNKKKYKMITGGNIENVIEGLKEASKYFYPIKINFLAMKINIEELEDMLNFCKEIGAILQIIEFLLKDKLIKDKYYISLDNVEEKIKKRAKKISYRRKMHNRVRYILENDVEVEFVRPMDNSEFCMHCTRLRLTADGYLKPCLLRNDNLVDILTPLRNGEDLEKYFLECIKRREPYFKK